MDTCPDELERERFLNGVAAEDTVEAFELHLEACAGCRAWIDEARAGDELLDPLREAWRETSGAIPPELLPILETGAPALERYRIGRLLGSGGMGVVYEAEQMKPHRQVALKVVRSGLSSDQLLRRFEFEAEVLSRLDHPGIARIYEAGTLGSGADRRPFFAMELVRGRPLMSHVEERGAGLRERLRLFGRVCSAVEHAHQRGVVHRDLKPANVLVTDAGEPKILDFGVARVIDADGQQATRHTNVGQIVGTLAYMSPEQVGGDAAAADVRSDVYSLGVLFHELLVGERPYDVAGRPINEAVRIIREQPPRRLGAESTSLRGDLETIAAKALEKDPARRYASAGELGADVARYLSREPISARPPSAVYHLRMFARRNRGVVAGVTLAFAALAVGIVATSQQARRASAAEADAVAEATTASETSRFLQALIGFDAEDPAGVARSGDTTMREVMSDAGGLLARNPFSDPWAEAEIRVAIGNAQRRFGLREEAVGTLERALELRLAAHGENDPSVAGTLNTLGVARYSNGDAEGAIADWHRALAIYRELGSPEPEKEATTLGNLAAVLTGLGQLEQAESMLLETLAVHEQRLGPETLHVASDLHQLAKLRIAQDRTEEAIGHLEQSLGIIGAIDADHPQSVVTATALLDALKKLGRLEQAEIIARDLVQLTSRIHGEGSSQWADAQHNLAYLLQWRESSDQARDSIAAAIEAYRDLSDRRRLALALSLQTRILLDASDASAAEASAREAVELYAEVLGADHPDCAASKVELAQALVRLGRDAEAEPLLREAVYRSRSEPLGRGSYARAASGLADLLLRADRDARGLEDLHRSALRALDELPRTSRRKLRCVFLQRYGVYLGTVGEPRLEEAEVLLRESLELSLELYGERAPQTATIRSNLAGVETLQQRADS